MKIGIIGAGYVGRSLAGAGVKAGHEVMISNSRGPNTLFSECALIAVRLAPSMRQWISARSPSLPSP